MIAWCQYHERAVLADGHAVHFAVAKLGDGEAADDLRHVFTSDRARMASLTAVVDGQFARASVWRRSVKIVVGTLQ